MSDTEHKQALLTTLDQFGIHIPELAEDLQAEREEGLDDAWRVRFALPAQALPRFAAASRLELNPDLQFFEPDRAMPAWWRPPPAARYLGAAQKRAGRMRLCQIQGYVENGRAVILMLIFG